MKSFYACFVTANVPLWKPLTAEHVQLLHIDYAAKMVNQLVPYTEDANLPAVVQNAYLESFFVNVRLLAEFLQGWGNEDKDFWATTLLPTWIPAGGDLGKRLKAWWVLASQHVVHFGKPRLANHAEDDLDVTIETLGNMRDDVLGLYGRFRTEYRDSLPEGHPDKHLGIAPLEIDDPEG